jgi:N,N'-diacetyllegionaminate synthase
VEGALGDGVKRPVAAERDTARAARRSLVAARPIPAGTKLSAEDVVARRPGTGIPPSKLADLLGCRTRVSIPEGAILCSRMMR